VLNRSIDAYWFNIDRSSDEEAVCIYSEAHALLLALFPVGCIFNHLKKAGTSSAIFPGKDRSTIN